MCPFPIERKNLKDHIETLTAFGIKLQVEAGDPPGNVLFVIAVILAELLFAKFFFIRGDEVVKDENT